MTSRGTEKHPTLLLFVWLIVTRVVSSSNNIQEMYRRLRVPRGYFLPMEGHQPGVGTDGDCALACTMAGDGICTVYKMVGSTQCLIGTLNLTNPIVPDYIPDGTDVMVQAGKFQQNAIKIPHVASLKGVATNLDSPVENVTQFSPINIPRLPHVTSDKRIFGWADYNGGIVSCGVAVGQEVVKKCWLWKFNLGRWTELRGTLHHGHFQGQLVQSRGHLWIFMGKYVAGGGTNHKKVESYDPKQGVWKEEPEANVEYAVRLFATLVFDDTKVRQFNSNQFFLSNNCFCSDPPGWWGANCRRGGDKHLCI